MGQVEAHHHDRPGFVEDDVRGLRVDDDVELGRGGPVAHVHPAAHEHDLCDALDDARLLAHGQGDVGQRAGGHECDRSRLLAHDRLNDEVHGVALGDLNGRLRQREALDLHAGLAVNVLGYLDLLDQRPRRASVQGGRR